MTSEPYSNFQLVINALADYTNLTGVDLSSKNTFAENLQRCSTPDAILDLLQEREKAFKEFRDGNRNLIKSISPAVSVVHAFSAFLGEAINLVPFQPAKAIFVGIDVLLAAASGISSSYDALLELFECLGSFLKRLEIYTNIPPTPIMTDIVVKILLELLSVLALATKQIKQGRFKQFAKKLLGESEVEAVLQRLDRLTQEEARTTLAQTLSVVHGLVNNTRVVMEDGRASMDSIRQALGSLQQMINDVNKMKRDQFQRDVRLWLSPPDPSTNHDIVSEAQHEGSATWFFESGVVTDWKSRGSLLWIHGKPGCGKSTLMSAIIHDIEGLRRAGLAVMAYYYFDFRDIKKQDRNGLLTSLLSQLSAESDTCYEVLSQLYSHNAGGTRKPTSSSLAQCMKDILASPGQGPIYIIVDALDECPDTSGVQSSREKVLDFIGELVSLNLPNVHICAASRPEIDIRNALEPLKPLQISLHDQDGQKKDIIQYIKAVIHSDRKMKNWREEDKQLVIDTLSDKADGMFRWVVCQIDRLRRCLPSSIRRILNDLPEGLDETYTRILLGIDREKQEYARRLFQCLTVPIRPLRVEELAEIFAVHFDESAPPIFNPEWRLADANEAVLSACSSLVSIVSVAGYQVVQFAHFSVKEFFTSERLADKKPPLSCYHILPEPAHATLARACLSFLLHLDDKIDKHAIQHFPLALYAAQHWIDHARFGGVSSQVQDLMERLFDSSKPHFAAWIWLYDVDHHWLDPMSERHPTRPSAVPQYYAALCGFRGLVERFLVAHPQDINARGGFYDTPLHVASAKGHFETVQLLLDNNADPHLCDHDGDAPLHSASQSGHVEVVKVLLDGGVDMHQRGMDGWTALHFASNRGRVDMAHFLIRHGAVVDAVSDNGETALHLAALSSDLEVAQLLINSGATVDVTNKDIWTPLLAASYKGNCDLVELLLSNGASLEARSESQDTPLALACRNGRLEVSQFLLDHGLDVNSRDKDGDTPLHIASQCGHHDVAQLLLHHGAYVDSRNDKQQTPLFQASSYGYIECARLLIAHGAAASCRGENEWTPFHSASGNGHIPVIRLLNDAGAAIDVQNGSQQTPLSLASAEGKADVANWLIDRGANINARDDEGWAPLHFASCHGYVDMTCVLLDRGVDPNVREDHQWTPLYLASANGHLQVAKLLVQRCATVDVPNDEGETPLDRASSAGHINIVRFLLDQGANLHTTDSHGWTPLHSASQSGHLEVVELLLARGADVDIQNEAHQTAADLASENDKVKVASFLAEYKVYPIIRSSISSATLDVSQPGTHEDYKKENSMSLHAASKEGDYDVAKSLLDRGTDINSRNDASETPLHVAAAEGQVELVQLLLERGAEVNSRDRDGWIPLHEASRRGEVDISRILIDHGANVNARNCDYWIPVHLAAFNGHLGVVKLLLERGADTQALNDAGQTPYQLSLRSGYRTIAELLREQDTCGA